MSGRNTLVAGAAVLVLAVTGITACGTGEGQESIDFKDPFWSSPPLVDYTSTDYLVAVDKDASGADNWEKADTHCFGSVTERNLAAVRVQSAIDRDDQARRLKQLPDATPAGFRVPTPSLHAAIASDPGVSGHDLNLCFTVVYTNKSLASPR